VIDNVGKNGRKTVVKEIGHIHFTALALLNLTSNNIDSIEGLARVQMVHIKVLELGANVGHIGSNNITSVGVIRKAAWPIL
jgi:hypothetical protein